MSMIATRKEDILVNYLCLTGHICADINQGALSATLPFLVMYAGYSYTAVAGLIFAVFDLLLDGIHQKAIFRSFLFCVCHVIVPFKKDTCLHRFNTTLL